MIDARRTQETSELPSAGSALEKIQTEIEIIKSPSVSLSVIKTLSLADDSEFARPFGLFGRVVQSAMSALRLTEDASAAPSTSQILAEFERRRAVARVGQSNAIEIEFRSLSAAKSAQIVNAIAEAYFNEQLEAQYQSAKRTSAWLQEQIDQLRKEASDADRALVEFKRANGIVDNGNGQLMNQQQVSEMNSQLILARAAEAQAKARLDRIQYLLKQNIPDASVADALQNEVIIRMRNQYLEVSTRERLLEQQYGATHLATVNLRNQMAAIAKNILDEMNKIAESYKSDYEIALAREKSLSASLSGAVSDSENKNEAQIQVRDLESKVLKYRTIYEKFLNRYLESVQQQSFPLTEAHLIGPALPPTRPSQPNALLDIAISIAVGLGLSFAIAFFRELSDRSFRTDAQIEEILGIECIATLPLLPPKLVSSEDNVAEKGLRVLTINGALRYAVDFPMSHFAEGLRSIKLAGDLNENCNRVIGITSTLPGEGKTTIGCNFAELIAFAGDKTILIDCDLRNPSLSRRLVPNGSPGLVDVLSGKITVEDAVWTDPSTGMVFLAAGTASHLLHTSRILNSDSMRGFVEGLRGSFDYIVVDCSPLVPIVDARASRSFVDTYAYVIEWGRTKRELVERTLEVAPEVRSKTLGAVLNKADLNVMSRYEGHASKYAYLKKYYGYNVPVS